MNKETNDAIMKGIADNHPKIQESIKNSLDICLIRLTQEENCNTVDALIAAFPIMDISIRSLSCDVDVTIFLDDIQEDMKGPLTFLAKRGHLLIEATIDHDKLTWQLTKGIYIYGILKDSKCKWVQMGMKKVPNIVLKCD